jgi:hypothetical protein
MWAKVWDSYDALKGIDARLSHISHACLDFARVEREDGATLASRHAERDHQYCASQESGCSRIDLVELTLCSG